MIRIRRPTAEPTALQNSYSGKLSNITQTPLPVRKISGRALAAVFVAEASALPTLDLDHGYQCARSSLYIAQHRKCCYCERAIDEKWKDVEHFRPKSVYWWLTWTWSNLLFICKSCNGQKSSHFPLRSSACCQPMTSAPASERPWLLDPALPTDDDPVDHIEFKSVNGNWMPFPRAGSKSGAEIIATCGLTRATLLDDYRQRAEDMQDGIIRIQDALKTKDRQKISAVWAHVTRRWLSASAPLTALVRDILAASIPCKQRKKYCLSIDIRY